MTTATIPNNQGGIRLIIGIVIVLMAIVVTDIRIIVPTAVRTADATVEGDYYICYDATECNAGPGSGWSSGSAANDGTSRSSPWQCPRDIEGNVVAGDVILVGDGIYNITRCSDSDTVLRPTGIDGSLGNPITLRAENKHGAVFDGEETSQDGASMSRNIIFFEWNDYWEIDGFELTRADRGIQSYQARPSTNITLKNLKIHDIGFSGVYSGILDHDWSGDALLIYDIWSDSGWDANNTCVHEHGWYMNGYNITLTNSVLHSSDGGTIITFGGFCDVDGDVSTDNDNFTHSYKLVNNTIDGNGCVVTYTEPLGDLRYNTTDFYNRTLNSGNYCSGLNPTSFPNARGRNYKNIITQNNLFLNGQTASYFGEPAHSYGNTNSESVTTPPSCYDFPWYSTSCVGSNGDVGTIELYNNVSADNYVLNPTHQGYVTGSTGGVYSNNTSNAGEQNLTDEANNDYTPTASSTDLCGQGRSVDLPATDFNGNARTQADIGAIACP